MRLAELVAASNAVAGNPARLEKTRILAELLQALTPEEVPVAVAFLAGRLRQGRLGLGHATLWEARENPPAPQAPGLFDQPGTDAPLALRDVDAAFERLKHARGKGVGAERARILAELYARASSDERDFLERLLLAELRQGALMGVMVDAVARASGRPLAEIRRAAMLAGDLEPVAVAALTEGDLRNSDSRSSSPCCRCSPARRGHRGRAGPPGRGRARVEARRRAHPGPPRGRHRARLLAHAARGHARRARGRRIGAQLPIEDAILDGEVIALRPDGRPHPFQVTMRRFGRQLEVEDSERSSPVDRAVRRAASRRPGHVRPAATGALRAAATGSAGAHGRAPGHRRRREGRRHSSTTRSRAGTRA
jgi:DNA ligase-1